MCCVVPGCSVVLAPLKQPPKRKQIMQTLNRKHLMNKGNFGVTLAEAQGCIARLEPFHTGTLSGAWERYDKNGTEGYVVRSYGVLIAESYKNYNGLATDAYNYSTTTSKHANLVKKAWAI